MNANQTYTLRTVQSSGSTLVTSSMPVTFTPDWSIPTVDSLTLDANSPPGQVHYNLHFTKPVTGLYPGSFHLITTGSVTGASIANISGGGDSYMIAINPGSGWGTLQLELLDSSIHDAAGTKLGGSQPDSGNTSAPALVPTLTPIFTSISSSFEGGEVEIGLATSLYTPPAGTTWSIDWDDGTAVAIASDIYEKLRHTYHTGDGLYYAKITAHTPHDGDIDGGTLPVNVLPSAPSGFNASQLQESPYNDPGVNNDIFHDVYDTTVHLSWTAASELADFYQLEVSINGGDYKLFATGIPRGSTTTASGDGIELSPAGISPILNQNLSNQDDTYFDLTGLDGNTNYGWRVSAYNAAGSSAASTTGINTRPATSGQMTPYYGPLPHANFPAGMTASWAGVYLGFEIDFFGVKTDDLTIYNDGRVMQGIYAGDIDSHFWTNEPTYSPGLFDIFYAPLLFDTLNDMGAGNVHYGPTTYQGHRAFGIHWNAVQFYIYNDGPGVLSSPNSYRMYIVDRSDTGTGNFDLVYQYDSMTYDTRVLSPGSNPIELHAHAGYSNGSGVAGTSYQFLRSGLSGMAASLGTTPYVFPIRNQHLAFTAYRTSQKYGEAVTQGDRNLNDPNRYVLLANDDFSQDPDHWLSDADYNASLTDPARAGGAATINLADTDLARISLAKLPSYWKDGQLTLSFLGAGNTALAPRIYDVSGHLLGTGTFDLTNPSTYLSGLKNGSLDIYVEAVHPDTEVTFREQYHNNQGIDESTDIHFRIVSIATQAWSHLLANGASDVGTYVQLTDGSTQIIPDSAKFTLDTFGLTRDLYADVEIGRAGSDSKKVRIVYSANEEAHTDIYYSYNSGGVQPYNNGVSETVQLDPEHDDLLDEVIRTRFDQLKRTVQGATNTFYAYAYQYNGFTTDTFSEAHFPVGAPNPRPVPPANQPNGYATPDHGLEEAMFANFKALYGDYGQTLLDAYWHSYHADGENVDYTRPYFHFIQVVHRNWLLSNSVFISVDNGGGPDKRDWGIRIKDSLTPPEAAKELYARLIEAAGGQRGVLRSIEQMAMNASDDFHPTLNNYDDPLMNKNDDWNTYRQVLSAVVTNIAQEVEFLATNYFKAIALVGEGANIIVCINDIVDGEPAGIIGLIPVVGKAVSQTKAKMALQFFGEKIGNILDSTACKVFGTGCFLPGTLVQTQSGLVPIEDVHEGDLVWSYDRSTNEWILKPVEAAFRLPYNGLVYEVSTGGDTITATETHPFFVVSGEELALRPASTDLPSDEQTPTGIGRWVDARYLRIGDEVRLRSNQDTTITNIDIDSTVGWVYNLTVNGLHDFAVGSTGILVHNGVACTAEQQAALRIRWRDGFKVAQDGSHVYYINGRRAIWGSKAFKAGGFIKVVMEDGTEATVKFKQGGFPNFVDFLYKEGKSVVNIVLTGDRGKDFTLANAKAGYPVTPEGFIWHHSEVLGRMELVEKEIHELIRHTGGFSIFKAAVKEFGEIVGIIDSSL